MFEETYLDEVCKQIESKADLTYQVAGHQLTFNWANKKIYVLFKYGIKGFCVAFALKE
jgi:hypothetical protein